MNLTPTKLIARIAVLAGATAMASLASCNAVLGIEERTLDPELGTGTGVEALSCETYCNTVMDTCTGDNALYASVNICLGACAELPLGNDADPTGNTVSCRLKAARDIQKTLEFEDCPAAGPGGDDVCGSDCEGFCDIMLPTCVDVFEDEEDCLDTCAEVPTDGEPYHVPYDNVGTMQCRLYHLTSALEDTTHCAHADGTEKCIIGSGGSGGGG